MKKILIIFLLIALTFSACGNSPKEYSFEDYGVAITLSGNVKTEINDANVFTLYTNLGTFTFIRFEDVDSTWEDTDYYTKQAESNGSKLEILKNGGFFYDCQPRDSDGTGRINIIETVCEIKVGTVGWRIRFACIENQYNRQAIIDALNTVRFFNVIEKNTL